MNKLCKRCGARMDFEPGRRRGGSWFCSQSACPASKVSNAARGEQSRRRRGRPAQGAIQPRPSAPSMSIWNEPEPGEIKIELKEAHRAKP